MTDEQMDALAAKCWRESRYSGRDGQDFDHRDFARQVLAAAAVVQASEPDLAKRLISFRHAHHMHWTEQENQLVVDCVHALRAAVLADGEPTKGGA